MKKEYLKPTIEVEVYTLTASIAHLCSPIISMGPGNPLLNEPECDEFKDSFGGFAANNSPATSFYEKTCDCYYSAGGEGYFTS